MQTCWFPLTEVSRVPPLPSCNGPRPLTWTKVTPSVSCYHSILGVCTTAAVLELWLVRCSLVFVFFSFFFSRKTRAVLLQRDGAAVHYYSSEHSSVIGRVPVRTRDEITGPRSGYRAGGGTVALMVELMSCHRSLPASAHLSSYNCGKSVRVLRYGHALPGVQRHRSECRASP